jgi:DNA polymerase-1
MLTDMTKFQDYLDEARLVAFDFETAPREKYRQMKKTALDAHKAVTPGEFFSPF